MLSRADEEIPTTDVKLELELGPQEASIKSPNLALHCALRSTVQPHMALPALAYTKVILLHHPPGVKKKRIAAERSDGEGRGRKRKERRWGK